jgi:hypothetical protein
MADTTTTTTESKIPAWEVFKAQFSPYFTNIDVEAPWLNALYTASQKYYNQGFTDAEIPDQLLTDENAPQAYKDRFAGIFKLKELKAKNPDSVLHIPSVSEYATMQKDMTSELNKRGLNSLATNTNFANIIGNNVDYQQFTDRLDMAFDAIDNADVYLKEELKKNFPAVGRNDIAMALLTGEEGAKALKKKVDVAGVRAAASEFGLQTQTNAEELVNMGIDRASARAGYQRTATELTGLTEAQKRFGGTGDLQTELEKTNVLDKQSQEVNRLRSQARAEFSGQTGVGSTALRRKRQV